MQLFIFRHTCSLFMVRPTLLYGMVDSQRGLAPANAGEVGAGHLEGGGARCPGGGGEFRCAAAYPSPEQSTRLGRQNLHLFRLKNTRFDVIGGAFYFLLVVSPWRHAPSALIVFLKYSATNLYVGHPSPCLASLTCHTSQTSVDSTSRSAVSLLSALSPSSVPIFDASNQSA